MIRLAVLVLLSASGAQAQPVTVARAVLGAGASRASGGGYTVRATLGQAVTGVATAGGVGVGSGFWPGAPLPGPVSTEAPVLPTAFALRPVRPNPSRQQAQIVFDVPRAASVRLTVYDLLGRTLAVVTEGVRAPGEWTETLDVSRLPSASYVVRLEAEGEVYTRHLTVAR